MDIVKIIGVGVYDFKDDRGNDVKGWKYHVARMPTVSNFEGFEAASFSVSDRLMSNWVAAKQFVPVLGTICGVLYNRYGRVDQFQPIDDTGDLFAELC